MKMNREGEGSRRKFGGTGRKEDESCRQTIQLSCLHRKTYKLNCLQGNLNIFIASIYMKSRKVLKERMRSVLPMLWQR